jgi:malate dehydrogenase (oxaloacetate-decarboxylating)
MLTGYDRLADRYRNKGTAFTEAERHRYRLHGLLPPVVEDLDTQLARACQEYEREHTDLGRHLFLRSLQERNSVLFYRFLTDHLEQMLPIVYTPTVGLACQEWSRTYRRQHGMYVSVADRHRIPELLDNAIGDSQIDVVVVTDGERVLGLGDLGIGGMGIPIGKLALYTAFGMIEPERTLPVFIDVGTDNEALLSDPLYMGTRCRRLRGAAYDDLVDAFVDALAARCPGVLLQWEDFAQVNATRLLDRHRERICSFNDDIQGTAGVTVAAIVGGLRIGGTPVRDLRLVILGAGSAGTGIARQAVLAMVAAGLPVDEARRRCWLVDRDGLLHDRMEGLQAFQREFARPWDEVAAWTERGGRIDLQTTVERVAPHALVGVSGQPGLFTEAVIRAQAARVERPIVLPLSNPTPRAEAIPADVVAWTDGRALVGTGSPFAPVVRGDVTHRITQVNNLYLFPGLGRGVTSVEATQVTDAMLTAAAVAIGSVRTDGDDLLPPITRAAEVAEIVAFHVARQAVRDEVAPRRDDDEITALLEADRWCPVYRVMMD